MNFINLPIDVGVLIFNYLNTKSKINVYSSCSRLREFFAPCHVKKLVLSRSTLAVVKTLNHGLFLELGLYIQELCLSGMPDLTSENLKLHITKFPNLTTLDITFTDVYLSDFVKICPINLKNLAINFFKQPRKSKNEEIWKECRQVFESRKFTKVHFVVFELLDSETPLMFLEGLPIVEDLKVTIADNYKKNYDSDINETVDDKIYDINFSQLFYVLRDCRVTHKNSKCLRGVANLDFKRIEYIFIMYLERIVIYVSPVLRHLFLGNCQDLKVEVCSQLPLDFMLDGNIIFRAWSKDINFNDDFMKKLLLDLKDYFPTYICMHDNAITKVINSKNDWYCIDACQSIRKVTSMIEKLTLSDFCRVKGMVMTCERPFSFLFGPEVVKNLSYLRLSNVYLTDFAVLFSACSVLETLDIYVEKPETQDFCQGFTLPQSINLVKNLKNIKVTTEDIVYNLLFETLSQCAMLENIHICEYERCFEDSDVNVDKIELMIENCKNLYSLYIETEMSAENLTMFMSPIKQIAQKLERNHLHIEVCDCYRGWNLFGDVFNPSPLHILD
ncbi:LOW QUALITY PROTEIN: uncharacterized protein LOC128201130 [Galleria mellonella]|uniref:LOW QUALITY PROTEIN: uncharacterized protein LOC128201130 n=1 Tax=Galleria mellonella TaxID=7137 RepID=A0ABM3MP31_GALME|nr:LOW QUALITY PROTEIN: uncharacterized protein LOC128201130 [Galleria mellonella]